MEWLTPLIACFALCGAASATAIILALRRPDSGFSERLKAVEDELDEHLDKTKAAIRDMEREWEDWHTKLRAMVGRFDKRDGLAKRARSDVEPADQGPQQQQEPAESDAVILRRVFGGA